MSCLLFIYSQDLIDVYNAEKLRLDILKAKNIHIQEAFMGSSDRFRLVQRKVLKMRLELEDAEKEVT